MKTFIGFAMSSGFDIGIALPISSSSKSVNALSNLSRKCEDRALRFQTEYRTRVVRGAFESPYRRKRKCHISQAHLKNPFAPQCHKQQAFQTLHPSQSPRLALVKTRHETPKMFLRNGARRARLSLPPGESPPRSSSHSQFHKGALCITLVFHHPQPAC